MELYDAHREWATRPKDERFATLAELENATLLRKQSSSERGPLLSTDLRAEPAGKYLSIRHGEGDRLALTHWSGTQLCQRIGAPRDFLADITPEVAALAINDRLAIVTPFNFHTLIGLDASGPVIRALTGER